MCKEQKLCLNNLENGIKNHSYRKENHPIKSTASHGEQRPAQSKTLTSYNFMGPYQLHEPDVPRGEQNEQKLPEAKKLSEIP